MDHLLIVSDPREMDWAYDLLKEPKETWKEGGHEHLVDRVRKIEQGRVEHYARRVVHLEEQIAEKDRQIENRTVFSLGLVAILVTPVLANVFGKILKK